MSAPTHGLLTPLPGSQDHKELHERGVVLGPDMNKYDTFHVTAPIGNSNQQAPIRIEQRFGRNAATRGEMTKA